MNRSVLAVALGIIALSACSRSPIDDVEDLVRHTMLDPDAVQFRAVELFDGNQCAVGELNAKNRMGAYTSFRAFVVNMANKKVGVAPGDERLDREEYAVASARMQVVMEECGI